MDRAREHIRPWVGPAFATTADRARTTLQRYATDAAADGSRLYGIWLEGDLSGGVMFTHFDARGGVCELGCWLEPRAEGSGLVTRACHLLLGPGRSTFADCTAPNGAAESRTRKARRWLNG